MIIKITKENKIRMSDYNTSIYDLLFNSKHDYGSWLVELKKEEEAIKQLSDVIEQKVKETGEYYPLPDNVFRALRETPLEDVKVVLWGSEPYPQLLDNGQARDQGLSFSVCEEDDIPGSLRNMHKEMKTDFPMFEVPDHGDLTYLSKQGVLLMNSALTHCPSNKKIYLKLWRRFTKLIIDIINEHVEGCVHVLLGNDTTTLTESIQSRNVIAAPHPSIGYRFRGSRIFLKINKTLNDQGKKQINWNIDTSLKPTYIEFIKDYKK
jgi:uracil-DNA glycosylase